MKRHRILLSLALAALAAVAIGQSTPTAAVRFRWDPNPPEDEVTGFFLYASPSVTGPWRTVAAFPGDATNGTAYGLPKAGSFFFLTASNIWGESEPSNMVRIPGPANNTAGLQILSVEITTP